MPLVCGERVGSLREDLPEVCERLAERIGLRAHGRRMFAQQKTSRHIEPVPTTADDSVHRFEGKREREDFGGGLDRRPAEQF